MAEKLVKSVCQNCYTNIEFDADGLSPGDTQYAECPNCHKQTQLIVPRMEAEQNFKGTILDYSIQTNTGIISGQNGRRYSFKGAEWKENAKHPVKGDLVDFVGNGDMATQIYLVEDANSEKPKCDKMIAGLLAILLGWLGVHKFYIGDQRKGVIYLLCGVLGVCVWAIPTLIIWIISVIEGASYLSSTQKEFEKKYVKAIKSDT